MLKASLIGDCCLPRHIDHVDSGQGFADGIVNNRTWNTEEQEFPTELELAEGAQYEGIADERAGELGIVEEPRRAEFTKSRRDGLFAVLLFAQAVDDLLFGSRTHGQQTQGGVLCGEERFLGDQGVGLGTGNVVAYAQPCTKKDLLAEAD